MNNDILEPIREAVYNAKREMKPVIKIHVTLDFKLQIQAAMPNIAITLDRKEIMAETILGYPVEVHKEKTNKAWWLETQ